ncbi:MAG: hypothetical protein LBQ10_07865 [Desulfovibrio sp.]|nr:hypothetical protein [Desulfovibrio sp.]
MGKVIRIQDNAIEAMRTTLESLPDKNPGRTRREAADMLRSAIMKAYEKGYTAKELAEIMSGGDVSISKRVLRTTARLSKPAPKKMAGNRHTGKKSAEQPRTDDKKTETANTDALKAEAVEKRNREPAYYASDIPDEEL